MNVKYKGANIHFTSAGEGNPIILLHGFMESSKIWGNFIPTLSEQRQVVCIDLPGHGESGSFNEIHSMEDMAKAVKEVLRHLEIRNAAIAGHSMGGYVCLELYKIFPTLLTSLVLVNSTPEADSRERKINRERAVKLVQKNKKAFVKMAISNLMMPENSERFRSGIQDLIAEAMKMEVQEITAAIRGMKIRTDNVQAFARMNLPKYIVAGKDDSVLAFDRLRDVANSTGAELLEFSGGHLSYIEDEKALLKLLHFIE
ncbi:alpha/beta fold hydrolase [Autumnicola musiva]|uniref:Alpha/beta hydrolase n=1 Tax=Autumnicola musiva TaxID=3075589 RepID=A0ABU3D123_9FLAO|nr:alpha/beta hydrolase [Zunongwangia sp. F117]MDT0675212.1 alpha/beta hydrolase [Zunongwangia sp. F117]